MTNALRELIGKICHVYLDDIIIWSQNIEEHKRLADSPTPMLKKRRTAEASFEAAPALEAAEPVSKKVRKRGRGSKRPRGGREKQEQKAGVSESRTRQLRERAFREGEAVRSDEFSMRSHGSASLSGWKGRAPPEKNPERAQEVVG
jgi:hypothetical protein